MLKANSNPVARITALPKQAKREYNASPEWDVEHEPQLFSPRASNVVDKGGTDLEIIRSIPLIRQLWMSPTALNELRNPNLVMLEAVKKSRPQPLQQTE